MSYRPHPNAERALRQLDRHHTANNPAPTDAQLRLAKQIETALITAAEAFKPYRQAFEALGFTVAPASMRMR